MLAALPRAIKAAGVFSILSGALSKDASGMNTDRPRSNKVPQPPQSTLDLQDHVSSLRLKTSIGYTGDADKDFAALLAVQRGTLVAWPGSSWPTAPMPNCVLWRNGSWMPPPRKRLH